MDEGKNWKSPGFYFFILISGVVASWSVWPYMSLWLHGISNYDLEKLGLSGDLYGGLNALFTAVAFAALVWTGLMQRQELSLQRNELKEQRKELSETRKVFEQQTFETTLFSLLNTVREIQNTQHAIEDSANFIRNFIRGVDYDVSRSVDSGVLPSELMSVFYFQHAKRIEGVLGTLLRTILVTLERVDGANHLSESEKHEYANIVRSQLSSWTTMSVALAGANDKNYFKLRVYTEKYGLLRYAPEDIKAVYSYMRQVYESTAFEC